MKPEYTIVEERQKDGFTVLTIDTKKASYQGRLWQQMGDFGKRKFENLLVIQRSYERLKFLYV